jgi:hypothetical protein
LPAQIRSSSRCLNVMKSNMMPPCRNIKPLLALCPLDIAVYEDRDYERQDSICKPGMAGRYRQTRSTSEPHACRYVQHLIKQYNEFAIADNKRSAKFRFGAVSTSIEIRFA